MMQFIIHQQSSAAGDLRKVVGRIDKVSSDSLVFSRRFDFRTLCDQEFQNL